MEELFKVRIQACLGGVSPPAASVIQPSYTNNQTPEQDVVQVSARD